MRATLLYVTITMLLAGMLVGASPVRAQTSLPSAVTTDVIEDTGLQAARESKTKSVVQNAFEQNKKIRVTLDGNRNYVGRVSGISATGFTLTEASTGQAQQVSYSDVRKLKRTGMSRGTKIGLGVGIGLGAVAVGSVIAFKPWRSE